MSQEITPIDVLLQTIKNLTPYDENTVLKLMRDFTVGHSFENLSVKQQEEFNDAMLKAQIPMLIAMEEDARKRKDAWDKEQEVRVKNLAIQKSRQALIYEIKDCQVAIKFSLQDVQSIIDDMNELYDYDDKNGNIIDMLHDIISDCIDIYQKEKQALESGNPLPVQMSKDNAMFHPLLGMNGTFFSTTGKFSIWPRQENRDTKTLDIVDGQ
jgi:type I site-specific restriction endonuclease